MNKGLNRLKEISQDKMMSMVHYDSTNDIIVLLSLPVFINLIAAFTFIICESAKLFLSSLHRGLLCGCLRTCQHTLPNSIRFLLGPL